MTHDHHDEKSILNSVSNKFLEHFYNREFIGELENPDGEAELVGSSGDSIGIQIKVDNYIITKIMAQPKGCAYTIACAEALGHLVNDLILDKVLYLEPEDIARELDGLPDDHMHCARLALNTLGEAIGDYLEKAEKKLGER